MASWQDTFRRRMHGFEHARPSGPDDISVSIKVRVESGCFHREHSPHAYAIIDRHLAEQHGSDAEFAFEEHESGPEILVYLSVATASILLAKSVIDLVTTIVKARAESVRKGDPASHPVELIIRRVEKDGEFREERVMRFSHSDPVDQAEIEARLNAAAQKLAEMDAGGMQHPEKTTPAQKDRGVEDHRSENG